MSSRPLWSWLPVALGYGALCSGLSAQSYDDLTLVRDRPSPYTSILQVRAGAIGSIADTEDPAVGLEDDIGLDGSVYYRNERFGSREGLLEVYGGRDGALIGLRDSQLVGNETGTRIELTARYFPFYREGFYRGSTFVPTGRYEGRDYGVYLGFGRPAAEDLTIEAGAFYKRYSFEANGGTASNYVVPDDFNTVGARITFEHNTLVLDRASGQAREGYILTAMVEREQNDSNRSFGVIGGFRSELPSGLWRGRAHLEWLFPQSDNAVWEFVVDGSLSDEEDRINNYDAQRPQGNLWVDGQLRFRWDLTDYISITPFFQAQYVRILEESGVSSDAETFLGGGLDLVMHFSDALSLQGWYSYLDNESRPPVSVSEDLHGEHMFYVGMVLRIGSTRR